MSSFLSAAWLFVHLQYDPSEFNFSVSLIVQIQNFQSSPVQGRWRFRQFPGLTSSKPKILSMENAGLLSSVTGLRVDAMMIDLTKWWMNKKPKEQKALRCDNSSTNNSQNKLSWFHSKEGKKVSQVNLKSIWFKNLSGRDAVASQSTCGLK